MLHLQLLKPVVYYFLMFLLNFSCGLDTNPDTDLSTPDLAAKYGYSLEAHKVITDDGYILEIHRIPFPRYQTRSYSSGRRPTVLIMHGLGGSSADWVLSGPGRALAYLLADEGYDVWLGNNRGNVYSRRHLTISPNNGTFWDFSYDELGMFDLPATIDYILDRINRSKLLYIGHSQGVTQFLVMASQRVEYNSKVLLAVGLAPAAFTGNLRGPVTKLAQLTYFGVWVGEKFGYPEYGSRSPWGKFVSNLLCHNGAFTQFLCSNTMFLIAGYREDRMNIANLTVIIGHIPAGASWKQVVHYGQGFIHPGHFRRFDYGDNHQKNLRLYNSMSPPEYELERITTPLAIFSSDNDWLATTEDLKLLKSKLSSVILDYKMPPNTFNHYDFLWSISAPELVFEPIRRLLAKY